MWRYHGTYLSEDVAIKVLRAEHLNKNVWNEFTQEVYILRYSIYCNKLWDHLWLVMYLNILCPTWDYDWNNLMTYDMSSPSTLSREVQHTNVVRFIGACTKPPQFCIITGEIYVASTGCIRNLNCLLYRKSDLNMCNAKPYFLSFYSIDLVSTCSLQGLPVTCWNQNFPLLLNWCHLPLVILCNLFLNYLAEYMSGGSLYDFVHKQHNVLNLITLLKFAVDVCRGMCYLHERGIIHRDLKTANLLMDKDHVCVF